MGHFVAGGIGFSGLIAACPALIAMAGAAAAQASQALHQRRIFKTAHAVIDAFDLQQVERNARPFAHLAEGGAAHPRESIEGGRIEVGKRECSLTHGCGNRLEGHAGLLEALHEPRPTDVAGRERVINAGFQDPELGQPVDVLGVDSGLPGDLQA
jgi:hypothetical protein